VQIVTTFRDNARHVQTSILKMNAQVYLDWLENRVQRYSLETRQGKNHSEFFFTIAKEELAKCSPNQSLAWTIWAIQERYENSSYGRL